jgi:hypothetical protein
MTLKWRDSSVSEFEWAGSTPGEDVNRTEIAGTTGTAWIISIQMIKFTVDSADWFGGV